MERPKTVFLQCGICKHLTETQNFIPQEMVAENTYGANLVITNSETQELVFCESCTATIWPKEYAPIPPKVLEEKPKPARKTKKVSKKKKKVTKKRLTSNKKKRIMPASNDKNEDIEKN